MSCMLLAGCGVAPKRIVEVRPVPAHWSSSETAAAPEWTDFTFNVLAFTSARQGWIAGYQRLLRVDGDTLSVYFTRRTGTTPQGVAFRGPDDGWMGGFFVDRRGDAHGVLWRWQGSGWEPVDLSPVDWPSWQITDVYAAPGGAVWLTALINVGHSPIWPDTPERLDAALIHGDGHGWRVEELPDLPARSVVTDACFDSPEGGWFVGYSGEPGRGQAFALRRRDNAWEPAQLPSTPQPRSFLRQVACLEDGRAVALGGYGGTQHEMPTSWLLVFDGEWRPIAPPPQLQAPLDTMAAVAADDVWFTVNRSILERPAFVHWHHGRWDVVPAPLLPEGREAGYGFNAMQFVSPDDGWAIADDCEGVGLAQGLIFHYHDGAWHLRNWGWHFWDMPMFGLLGD
jgi:hypothetical protein